MEGISNPAHKRLTLHADGCQILAAFKAAPERRGVSFVMVQEADLASYTAQEIKIDRRCPCLKPPKLPPLPHREDPA